MSGRDWIRELNNYLQSIGQAANLSWAFTETGQSNVAVHYVTANLNGQPIAQGHGTTKSAAKSMAAQAYLNNIPR